MQELALSVLEHHFLPAHLRAFLTSQFDLARTSPGLMAFGFSYTPSSYNESGPGTLHKPFLIQKGEGVELIKIHDFADVPATIADTSLGWRLFVMTHHEDFLSFISRATDPIAYVEDESVDTDDEVYGFEKHPAQDLIIFTDGVIFAAFVKSDNLALTLSSLVDPDADPEDAVDIDEHILLSSEPSISSHATIEQIRHVCGTIEILNLMIKPEEHGFQFSAAPSKEE